METRTTESYSDEELVEIVYELGDDLTDLDDEDVRWYTFARDVLFDRGYTMRGLGPTIVDPDGNEVDPVDVRGDNE